MCGAEEVPRQPGFQGRHPEHRLQTEEEQEQDAHAGLRDVDRMLDVGERPYRRCPEDYGRPRERGEDHTRAEKPQEPADREVLERTLVVVLVGEVGAAELQSAARRLDEPPGHGHHRLQHPASPARPDENAEQRDSREHDERQLDRHRARADQQSDREAHPAPCHPPHDRNASGCAGTAALRKTAVFRAVFRNVPASANF